MPLLGLSGALSMCRIVRGATTFVGSSSRNGTSSANVVQHFGRSKFIAPRQEEKWKRESCAFTENAIATWFLMRFQSVVVMCAQLLKCRFGMFMGSVFLNSMPLCIKAKNQSTLKSSAKMARRNIKESQATDA